MPVTPPGVGSPAPIQEAACSSSGSGLPESQPATTRPGPIATSSILPTGNDGSIAPGPPQFDTFPASGAWIKPIYTKFSEEEIAPAHQTAWRELLNTWVALEQKLGFRYEVRPIEFNSRRGLNLAI